MNIESKKSDKSPEWIRGYQDGLIGDSKGYINLSPENLIEKIEDWIEGYQYGRLALSADDTL